MGVSRARELRWRLTGVAIGLVAASLCGCVRSAGAQQPERAAMAAVAARSPQAPAAKPAGDPAAARSPAAPATPPAQEEAASAESPLGTAIPIEDPSARALDAFHAALRRAQSGAGQARIVFYGASHVASDLFTGVVRERLQQRFGDAGLGFVLPGKPWRWYRHAGVHIDPSRGLHAFRIKERAPVEGMYGLAGVALDARRNRPARAALETRPAGDLSARSSHLELYYLKQPGGGHLSVSIDGKPARRIATTDKRREPGYLSFEPGDGEHRLELHTAGDGPVRVFGVALERETPGVILDTLGVPGTRVRDHLYFDDALYREHLARRKPDLVVLAYGTNESGDDDVPIEQYEGDLRRVVQRVHQVVPGASCLLIGPSDRPVREQDGSFSPRPRTAEIVATQRRVAAELGCGFFDLVRFMGGPMSMLRWVDADPPLGTRDYVHFTMAGYERLGNVLYDALLAGFEPDSAPATPPAVGAQPLASQAQGVDVAGAASLRPSAGAQELPRAVK